MASVWFEFAPLASVTFACIVVAPVSVCVPVTLSVPLSVSAAPASVPVSVGLADRTTLPLPVVVALNGCPLLLVPITAALAGTDPPLILTTLVAPCVPVTSPLRDPVKLVAFVTAVDPIAPTICDAVAATSCFDELVPATAAPAGTVPPLIAATAGLG